MSLSDDLLNKSRAVRQANEGPSGDGDVKMHRDWRWVISMAVMAVAVLLMMAEGLGKTSVLSMARATGWFEIPNLEVPAGIVICVMAVVVLAMFWWGLSLTVRRGKTPGWMAAVAGLAFVIALLVFAVAGREGSVLPIVSLLQSTLALSIPLVFGSLSGVVCERTGVINIAIEGQLLFGAFAAAVVATASGFSYVGLIGAPLAGALVSVLLALFTIKYRVDHIIVGVVLNMLVLGLTSFLYSTWLKNNEATLNKAMPLPNLKIPVLADIPIIGPVLFDQSLLVYLMYLIAGLLGFALFRTRWGLRTRACGEHPKAADTVGIKVNLYRWGNVLLGGALAGLGGAYFTIGAGLAFSKDMAAGNGFIALAAMILGKWHPKGAVAASLLFGFATALGYLMQSVNSPIPSEFLLMIPYLVTILAVAGFVGKVRPPAAEGKPYPA